MAGEIAASTRTYLTATRLGYGKVASRAAKRVTDRIRHGMH
jgi:hypothetical protein